jgi:hypothetical protein
LFITPHQPQVADDAWLVARFQLADFERVPRQQSGLVRPRLNLGHARLARWFPATAVLSPG